MKNQANILLITTDYIIMLRAKNFIDIRKPSILKAAIIFCENLSNIVKITASLSPH
jgi:hypothetical protein